MSCASDSCILCPKSKGPTPPVEGFLDSPGETSCGIHADHISICKYPSTYSPQCQGRVAATNISRSPSNLMPVINLVVLPDSSTSALNVLRLALFLYGAVGCDHVQLAELMRLQQSLGEVESLNLLADMRTSLMEKMDARLPVPITGMSRSTHNFERRKTAPDQFPASTQGVSTPNHGSKTAIDIGVREVVGSTISNVGNVNSGGMHLILVFILVLYSFPLVYLVLSGRE